MHRTMWLWAAVAVASALPVYGARKDCYVVDRNGQKIHGVSLTADANGNLQLEMEEGGPKQTFKPGTYRFGFVPMPKEVGDLEAAAKARKSDVVAGKASEVFERVKFLGWGGYVAYLQGLALLEQKKPADAMKAFEQGRPFAAGRELDLQKGCVLALVDLGRAKDAQDELIKMAAAESEAVAAFAFNQRGKILAREGKKREAVLQYLKTMLLFKPGAGVDAERDEARKAVAELLKELGDPRAGEFAKMP